MITGFENKHNMFFLDRPMAVQTVSRGPVLPRKETENGPMWGLGGVCDENGAFVALSAYDGGWATYGGAYPYEKPEYLRTDFIIEKGKAYGIDFCARYSYDKIYLWVAYSLGYIERTDEAEGTYNPHYDRRHNINALATYTAGNSREWEFSARWNFGSGFPFTKTKGIYEFLPFYDVNFDYINSNGELGVYYSAINEGRLPYYHRFDISAKRKFSLGRRSVLEINASITNVYNRQNMFYFNRLTFERVDQLPIMPSLGMTLTF